MIAAVLVIAHPGARSRERRDLGDPEVEHLDRERAVGATCRKRFAGFEIAVDDAERVGLGDGLAGLEDVLDRLLDRRARRASGARRRGRSPSRYSITM